MKQPIPASPIGGFGLNGKGEKNMHDVISVIIPVYNVETYLSQCLDSVLEQDHGALEVIVIDDGSKDNSGAICDAYAARDSRVKVIHQKNGGAAAAKNAGLRIATGEYLSFVDSDDYLEPNVYGYMLETLKSSGADAAQFAFRDVYRNRTEDQVQNPGRTVVDGKDYLVRFTKDWTCALLWNKLYKRSMYDGVFFEEGHKIDDEYFTYRGFLKPCKVVCDERIIYNYRKRASSVMSSPEAAEQRVLDCLDSVVKRRAVVMDRYPELRKCFDENYLDTMYYLTGNVGNGIRSLNQLKDHLKNYFRTRGNTFPPRYLWPMLWRLYFTKTEVLLSACQQGQYMETYEEYYS